MFLPDGCLDLSKFSPTLKDALSDFNLVLSKAIETYNSLIHPSHFFLALFDVKGGSTQKIFKSKGFKAQTLIELIHKKIEDKVGEIPLGIGLKKDSFSPASLNLLDELNKITKEYNIELLEEKHLLFAVLKMLEPKVKKIFDGVIEIDEIIRDLQWEIEHKPPSIFDPETGEIRMEDFDGSGKVFLKLLKEIAENTGYSKITSSHVGLALLSIEDGITQKGLRCQLQKPEMIKEALKSRIKITQETNEITLNRNSCYKTVVKILEKAAKIALEDGRLKVGESQILRAALLVEEEGKFADTLCQLRVNIESLKEYAEENLEVKIIREKIKENPWGKLKDRWSELEPYLKGRIVGQDHAIEVLIEKLATAVFGVREGNKPIGVLFFSGPTGVGKTEISRVLAEFVFGNPEAMIRFDMSEYMERHTVAKFIGAPPGYVGYEEGGGLVNKVRENPFLIILFDEFEKAHEEIFNIYLQIFDNAVLTDGHGNQAKFNNTLIILTSNLGSREAEKALSEEDRIKAYQGAFKSRFSPEFRNRISNVIIFKSFSKEDCLNILELELNKLKTAYEKEKEIIIEFSETIKKSLLERGFDEDMGARPLRRVVWDDVNSLISLRIANGEINQGDSVYLDEKKGKITFRVKR